MDIHQLKEMLQSLHTEHLNKVIDNSELIKFYIKKIYEMQKTIAIAIGGDIPKKNREEALRTMDKLIFSNIEYIIKYWEND